MTNSSERTIGYIVGSFPGTSETFILNEINGLVGHGMNIQCFSLTRNTEDVIHAQAKKWFVRTYWPPLLYSPNLWFAHLYFALTKPKKYFTACGRIKEFDGKRKFVFSVYFARLVQKKGIRHVYGQFGWCAGPAMLIGYLTEVGYSFILHHADIFFVPAWNIAQLINQSKFCVTISHYNKRYLIEKFQDIIPDKICVIHLGVDTKKFVPVIENSTVGEKVNLSNVARLVRIKNIPFLIKICEELRNKGYEFNCIVVGEGPERPNLEKQIHELGLEDRINLVGEKSQEELTAVYNKCDIFVLTSISEGIPVVAMEAMSIGLPVVAPNITGMSELVKHGQTGFLFNQGDLEQATDAVIKLVKDTDLRVQMGYLAREKVISEYNIHDNTRELAKLLFKVL